MFPIVRVGDINAAGGIAIAPRPTVLSSMQPLAAFASPVTPHPCCGVPGCEIHCVAVVTGGAPTVFAEGLPVHRAFTDIDSCGHPRTQGDFKVLVGGNGGGGASADTGLGTASFST